VDNAFAAYLRISSWVVRIVAMAMIIAMTGVSALEIGARAFLGISLAWAQEVSILAAMWVYFFAYALVAKQHDYIRVEFLVGLLPPAGRQALALAGRVVVIGFYATVCWYSFKTVGFLSLFHTDVLELPEYLFVLPLLLGTLDIVVTELIFLQWQLRGRTVPGSDLSPTAHAA
jgi:TRAP-type C4-dicarboxylate transport system permease small subunit